MQRKRSHSAAPNRRRDPEKKPSTEAEAAVDAPTSGSRRGFIGKALAILGGLAVVEYFWIALEFIRPRRSRAGIQDSAIVVAGPLERFEMGSVTPFQQGRFYLARLDDGGFLALHRKCTHLGCTVPWIAEERRFVCPCHASAFDIRGSVESPPAPRPLDLFPVRIENGIVKVDTSTPLRRQSHSSNQVTRI
jgi:cytochrome b6-f complex iron-sulfur subunit